MLLDAAFISRQYGSFNRKEPWVHLYRLTWASCKNKRDYHESKMHVAMKWTRVCTPQRAVHVIWPRICGNGVREMRCDLGIRNLWIYLSSVQFYMDTVVVEESGSCSVTISANVFHWTSFIYQQRVHLVHDKSAFPGGCSSSLDRDIPSIQQVCRLIALFTSRKVWNLLVYTHYLTFMSQACRFSTWKNNPSVSSAPDLCSQDTGSTSDPSHQPCTDYRSTWKIGPHSWTGCSSPYAEHWLTK